MPFIYDESEIEWPDDDSEPPRPRVDQFLYMVPVDFGGEREPVRFTAYGALIPSPEPKSPWHRQGSSEYSEQGLAILVPALRDLGARRAYCRYDGGHDEGFASLDHVEMQDGQRIEADALVAQLVAARTVDRDGLQRLTNGRYHRLVVSSYQDQLREALEDWIATEWASMLLGQGFGTGEYSMYGAFTVDFEARTITDDPQAEPAEGRYV